VTHRNLRQHLIITTAQHPQPRERHQNWTLTLRAPRVSAAGQRQRVVPLLHSSTLPPPLPTFRSRCAATKLTRTPQDTKLRLYGLYKQAKAGDVDPTFHPRPALYDVVGRAKWDAWAACKGVSRQEAAGQYCALVSALVHAEAGPRAVASASGGGGGGGGRGVTDSPAPESSGAGEGDGEGGGGGGVGFSAPQSRLAGGLVSDAGSGAAVHAAGDPHTLPDDVAAALFDAAGRGDASGVADVLARHPSAAHARLNAAGETALHVAADSNHAAVVRLLLAAGADPRLGLPDDPDATPLQYAELGEARDALAALTGASPGAT
jgi:diazepam-binding inhibitor (GABA receptor modulator, acyl-CoA-binding protein)